MEKITSKNGKPAAKAISSKPAKLNKRALIKLAILRQWEKLDLAKIAEKNSSTLPSVRSIRSDMLAAMKACRQDLTAEWQARIPAFAPDRKLGNAAGSDSEAASKSGGLHALNVRLYRNPAIGRDAMIKLLSKAGFSGFAIDKGNVGASISASLESFAMLAKAGAMKNDLEAAEKPATIEPAPASEAEVYGPPMPEMQIAA